MDDTLLVRRVELEAPRTRRVTTQFGPERKVGAWPWLCVAAILVFAALGRPWNPVRDQRLVNTASEVLRQLP